MIVSKPKRQTHFSDSGFAERVRSRTSEMKIIVDAFRAMHTNRAVIDVVGAQREGVGAASEKGTDQFIDAPFQLNGSDQLISDVLKYCELDSNNPMHWRILLEAVVEVGFKSPGARTQWDAAAYYELYIDILKLQGLDPARSSHIQLAKGLRTNKFSKKKYQKYTVDRLRKLVAEALDENKNPYVGIAIEEEIEDFIARKWEGGKIGRGDIKIVIETMKDNLVKRNVANEFKTS